MDSTKASEADALPPCDCLNDCGDDPDIRKGKVQPCRWHLDAPARAKEARLALYLSLKAEFDQS